MPAINVLLHLGGRHSLQCTKERTRYSAHGVEEGLAWAMGCWEGGNAATDGSRLRVAARWVRVLAFGTLARRESCTMDGGELPTTSDDAKSSQSADNC